VSGPLEAFMRAFDLDGLEMLALVAYTVAGMVAVGVVRGARGTRGGRR